MSDHWIAGAIKHRGSYDAYCAREGYGHHATHACIVHGEHSRNPTTARRAHLAETLGHLRHRKHH